MVHHGAGLRRLTRDDALVAALARDFREADISTTDRAMLGYALKITREPWEVTKGDVETLRTVGFEDRDILDINQIAAYFAFVNRLADGLGVELEDYWKDDPVPGLVGLEAEAKNSSGG